ncbi:DUF4153 domain-containing protein [Stenotrophomonas sp. CFBP 13725]|uniref:DUF4153 domain-containing protein n=1 Tax=Stenotrophomonas sp. CFBP 13725 TaxID=2775297 RepID=UPI00178298D8|nr:DUF4153 domain-containing protein [Stenotrophomonas sp. CFBP 13725]MBD8636452.1 DUF4153 domain-containing protein [Stenotrophomonas sp. CFBP 13725]
MPTSPPLPPSTRSAIVLIALLQGLMLYVAQELAGSWPLQDIGSRYRWYAWVLTVPTAIALTAVDLRDRRLWLHAAVASVVVLGLSSWIGWNLQGETGLRSEPLRLPFSLAMAIATFISLPWWQYRLQHGHWRASYDALFERAWQNGLTLALAALFTLLTWLLLWLWAALFGLLNITFFKELFGQDAFIALATGTLAGFGVLIGRTQQRAIQITRQVLFAVCRGLLPLLSFITVIFTVSLPFTGLDALWNTRSAAFLLITLTLLLVTFVNAVYQHDSDTPPYPAWLRRLVEASLLALPVLAALALYATCLRITQYGWTLDRFWAVLIAVVVIGYALGYGWAAVHRRGRWLQGLEPVNRVMCWVVLGAALLSSSPLLDPARITVASQRARLLANPDGISIADAMMLRFEVGRRGVQALRGLQQEPAFVADARASSVVTQVLARTGQWGTGEPAIDAGIRDVTVLRKRLPLASGSASPPDSWWQALLGRKLEAGDCLDGEKPCVIVSADFDNDGQQDVLLCALPHQLGAYCQLHALGRRGWWTAGSYAFGSGDTRDGSAQLHAAVREGKLVPQAPRWPGLAVDGRPPVSIDNLSEEPEQTP